jgi:hypothetical protein
MDILQSLNKNDDDYTTPLEVQENIKEYLPKGDAVIWEAFYQMKIANQRNISAP